MMKDVLTSTDNNINNKSEFYLGFKKGVNDSFNIFTSFVGLFKQNKNNVKLLMNEQKNIVKNFIILCNNIQRILKIILKHILYDPIKKDIMATGKNILNLKIDYVLKVLNG